MARGRPRAIPTPETQGHALRFMAEATGLSEFDAVMLATVVMIDSYLADDRVLGIKTGMRALNFHRAAAALARYMAKDPNSPLYWGKPGMESSAGRRCALAPRHMLFIYLEYLRHGASQDYVASIHNVSQTSVSRYCEYVAQVLIKFLPTGDNIAERIRKAKTPEEIQNVLAEVMAAFEKAAGLEPGAAGDPGETMPGNVKTTDGMLMAKERPTDAKERKKSFNGRKKDIADNVSIDTNINGAIMGVSELAPGSTHDLTVLREFGADLGLVTKCLEGKSGAMQMVELVDKGYRGLEKDHPGAVIKMPLPRAESKTKKARAHNRRVNRRRVKIEHTNRRIKTFARLRHRVRRPKKTARRDLIVATGLVNLHLLTGSPDKSNTHRKGKKPGPKTARSR